MDFHRDTRKEHKRLVENFKYDKNVKLVRHVNKLGCAGNMKYCLEYAFDENDYDYMMHLEDDTPVSPDYLLWMEWAYKITKDRDDIFCICPFTRKISGGNDKRHYPEQSILKPGFDCGGGYGMSKKTWEYIKSLGGMFGIVGPASTEAPPDQWKAMQTITWDGSWAWPFRRYFCRDKLNLFPGLNRTNNIGVLEGRFNPNPEFHKSHIYVENWMDADKYKDLDHANIKYEAPNIDRSKEANNLPH